MNYRKSQIEAVRELQKLHGIPGYISDENCKKYLDWWHSTKSRGIASELGAIADGLANGKKRMQQQAEKLRSLAE